MSVANYNEDLLVELLSEGAHYDKIAQAVGLTVSMVGKIARGDYRGHIAQRVREILQDRRKAVRDAAAQRAADLMRAHVAEGLTAGGETARKCREFILNHLLAGQDAADVLTTLLADSAKPPRPAGAMTPQPVAGVAAHAQRTQEPKDLKDTKDIKDAQTGAKDQTAEQAQGPSAEKPDRPPAAESPGGTAFPDREGGTAFPGRESQAGKPVPPDIQTGAPPAADPARTPAQPTAPKPAAARPARLARKPAAAPSPTLAKPYTLADAQRANQERMRLKRLGLLPPKPKPKPKPANAPRPGSLEELEPWIEENKPKPGDPPPRHRFARRW
ncbi:MAG: hypothetical protein ABFD92_09480 [Planctomycetaceae bacterium]|nr:hypothetical protein [Planctomycetaceae bacterium]